VIAAPAASQVTPVNAQPQELAPSTNRGILLIVCIVLVVLLASAFFALR
jgi:hypothetical protein